jgi:hypothetical protein
MMMDSFGRDGYPSMPFGHAGLREFIRRRPPAAGRRPLKKRCRRLEKVTSLGMIEERCETVNEAIRAGIANRQVRRANGNES